MLDKYRKEIDNIDKKIVELFEQRMEVSSKIGNYKKQNNLKILNKEREKEVIEKNINNVKNDDIKIYVIDLLNFIMEQSREYQKNKLSKWEIIFVENIFKICYL